jgi:hypothetical protein
MYKVTIGRAAKAHGRQIWGKGKARELARAVRAALDTQSR